MDNDKLKKAYEAIELLEALGLPVTNEQQRGIAELEKEFLEETVIPHLKSELTPFMEMIKHSFRFSVSFNPEMGIVVELTDRNKHVSQHSTNVDLNRVRMKYSFDGGAPLNKRRFVLAVVKNHVENHPEITLDELEQVFPSSLNRNVANGVVKSYDKTQERIKVHPDIKKRFFLAQEEIITLADGTKVVVHNQWGDDFENFLRVAKKIHSVEAFTDE